VITLNLKNNYYFFATIQNTSKENPLELLKINQSVSYFSRIPIKWVEFEASTISQHFGPTFSFILFYKWKKIDRYFTIISREIERLNNLQLFHSI
jgi:hypothetical protein